MGNFLLLLLALAAGIFIARKFVRTYRKKASLDDLRKSPPRRAYFKVVLPASVTTPQKDRFAQALTQLHALILQHGVTQQASEQQDKGNPFPAEPSIELTYVVLGSEPPDQPSCFFVIGVPEEMKEEVVRVLVAAHANNIDIRPINREFLPHLAIGELESQQYKGAGSSNLSPDEDIDPAEVEQQTRKKQRRNQKTEQPPERPAS